MSFRAWRMSISEVLKLIVYILLKTMDNVYKKNNNVYKECNMLQQQNTQHLTERPLSGEMFIYPSFTGHHCVYSKKWTGDERDELLFLHNYCYNDDVAGRKAVLEISKTHNPQGH